ncbi:type II secretion system protein GspL [Shewanella avicenniae]|uniref:Type II secretion system protein L n=1 Tax=Shewanella avicenniae TaxID=2814294 RepID=A0ABX7QRG6_9GAMM|nr:type II secretion system protein GspL [Shewanella avicenniae]QSX33510.1 type II secretion system protein GspL [Shewanella avicenniae]
MSERLFIRLGSNSSEPCSWLVWSEQEQEIIASGELADASALQTLSERAGNRPVDVLVPSDVVRLTQVNLPEKGQRQALKALPFLLEESLAQNIDELHFVPGAREGDVLNVAIVAHEQLDQWLAWLTDAGLTARKLVPDCLAVPLAGCQWGLLQVGEQYLLRTGEGSGIAVGKDWLALMLPELLSSVEGKPSVACYTEFTDEQLDCQLQPLDLPMLVLAKGHLQSSLNLLTGQYKPRKQYNGQLQPWKKVAAIAVVALLLGLANKGLGIYRYNSEAADLKAQSEAIYRQVAGNSRIVNLRSQLDSSLRALQGSGSGAELFNMLQQLEQPFKQVPELAPESLRFDGSRGELRMQVSAKSYEQIDKFRQLAAANFTIDAGAMNNNDGAVTSTLTLRSK